MIQGATFSKTWPPATADTLTDSTAGFYQGITRDHWVEVELGDEVPRDRPLWLVATAGSTPPTARSTSPSVRAGGPSRRDWYWKSRPRMAAGPSPGPTWAFPAGKNKTILVDLNGIFPPGGARADSASGRTWRSSGIRLPSPQAAPESAIKTQRLAAAIGRAAFPRLLDDDPGRRQLARAAACTIPSPARAQRWRDLIGFYTRFGDVRELLKEVDDRYVIANAGDELVLRFPAPPPPAEGWVRDFVLIGDGWNKDGDFNTAFSKTVLPLPSHKRPGYDAARRALWKTTRCIASIPRIGGSIIHVMSRPATSRTVSGLAWIPMQRRRVGVSP